MGKKKKVIGVVNIAIMKGRERYHVLIGDKEKMSAVLLVDKEEALLVAEIAGIDIFFNKEKENGSLAG